LHPNYRNSLSGKKRTDQLAQEKRNVQAWLFSKLKIIGFAIAFGVLAARTAWALDVPQDGAVIAIRSVQNDKFVRAGITNDSLLGASSTHGRSFASCVAAGTG